MADGQTYSAGNLELQVQTVGNNATASLSNVNAQLSQMLKLLSQTSKLFDNLAVQTAKLSKVNVAKGGQLKDYNKSYQTFDVSNGVKNLKQLTEISRVDGEVQKITKSFNEQGAVIKETTTKIDQYGNKITEISNKTSKQLVGQDIAKTLNLGKIAGKLLFIRNYTKQLVQGIRNIVQYGIDYTETLNLWQVAMRGNREEAEEFINTMNRAYGISTQTLMNYQAIFRNMLSSLGGISEMTSYALSEYLTQMALDYASLYNTSIERAMTTFQSVLSGQVRPVRSIAGYDITETTIYQLYQQLGGTKTMRQLSQTEKRLLRIYAVFQQMESSGAIGDLNKTLGNTANQLRMLNEGAKELQTWLGILMELYIKPILPYLNAIVITLTNIIKALAQMKGYQPFEGGLASIEEYNDALDETTGKLLSFDRFEALNSSAGTDGLFGIDESLLSGMAQYKSILEGVKNEAAELAEKWTSWWVDADTGELTDQAKNLLDVLKAIGITIGVLVGYNLIRFIGGLIGKITGLINASKLLDFALMTGVVYAVIKAKEAFEKGDTWGGILATTIGVVLVGAILYLHRTTIATIFTSLGKRFITLLANATLATGSFSMGLFTLSTSFLALGAAIAGAFLLIQNWGDMNTWQKIIGVIGVLTTAVLGLAMAFGAFHSAWSIGLAVAGIAAGIAMMVASIATVKKEAQQPVRYKTGGLVEDGVFTMNKGEIIGNFDDGSTVVANNQQIIDGIRQGVYSAVVSAMQQTGGNGVGNVYLGKEKVGQVIAGSSHREMVRAGYIKASS